MLLVARHEVQDVRMAMQIVGAEVARHPTSTYNEVSSPLTLTEAGARLAWEGERRLYPAFYREALARDFDRMERNLSQPLSDNL